jgi:hypothetical protein
VGKAKMAAWKRVFQPENDVLMRSDEDVPAPSPSATVLARRASREVKPMREESSSDEDAEEPEEWDLSIDGMVYLSVHGESTWNQMVSSLPY